MEESPKALTIKAWAEEDRPREKLLLKGRHSLSNAELIAILIATGSGKETAVDLAKRIMDGVSNNLNELGKLGVAELCKFKGIGEAKAISIIAALEIGKRRQGTDALEKPKMESSKQLFQFAQQHLADLPYEAFLLICMNRANRVIHHQVMSSGGISGTVADVRMIMKVAVEKLSTSIAIAHNHPSGNLRPSGADEKITQQIKSAALFFEITLLDHLIIGDNAYFSFADEGKL